MYAYRLRAIDPDKNIFRWYEIRLIQDLFREWSLVLSYGRIGSKGRTKTISFKDKTSMDHYTQKVLKKHLTSGSRIGCNYNLVN